MKIGKPEKFMGLYDLTTKERGGFGKYYRRLERHFIRTLEEEVSVTDRECVQYQMILAIAEMIEKHRRVQVAALVISTVMQLLGIGALIRAFL